MGQTSPRLIGRAIALLLLLLILCGVFAQGFVANRLIVSGDAAATARNIMAHPGLYRLGFTVFLIEMVANVANTALFYVLLRPVNRPLALTATLIDLTGGVTKTFCPRLFHRSSVGVATHNRRRSLARLHAATGGINRVHSVTDK